MATRLSVPDRYAISYGTELFDFSTTDWIAATTDGVGSIVEQDTTHNLAGSSAVKVLKPVGETLTELSQSGLTEDYSDADSLTLWFYLEGTATDFYLQINFQTSAGNTYRFIYEGDEMYAQSGWNSIHMPVNDFAVVGSPDWSNITKIIFSFKDSSTTGAQNGGYIAWVDSLYKNARCRPKLTIIIDDGTEANYTEAFDYAYTTNGMVLSSAIISNHVDTGGDLTTAQIQEMYNAGWEICNHGATGQNLTTQGSVATYVANANICKQFIIDNGWTGSEDIYVYGGCQTSNDLINEMKNNGYRLCRRCESQGEDIISVAGHPSLTKQSPHNVRSLVGMIYRASEGDTSANAISYIDKAIDTGSYAILILHNIVASGATGDNINRADFRAIIDAVKTRVYSGQIDLISFNEYMEGL